MPEDFWRRSIIQRPADRPVLCGASAWDFCDGRDYRYTYLITFVDKYLTLSCPFVTYRIKMCANPTFSDLISAHHELAHVQYYMHYATQPTLFKDGANPGVVSF
jgi:peptidyl-dipeptidase A